MLMSEPVRFARFSLVPLIPISIMTTTIIMIFYFYFFAMID